MRITSSFSALFLVLSWLALGPPAHAAEVAGATFDETVKVGERNLTLNGAGLRSKFMFNVYAIGLYLPKKAGEAGQAIGQAGPKRIRIVTLRDVGAGMFVDGLTKGIEKNHDAADLAVLKPRIDQLAATLRVQNEVAKGSVVTLDLTPDSLTRLSINGAPLGKDIPGEDFYRALMRVWLGNNPAQDDLKSSLLGH